MGRDALRADCGSCGHSSLLYVPAKFVLPDGGQQIPDLQVALSHGRNIIVDVKAPLDTYLQAHDEDMHVKSLQTYAESVRRNMMGLAKKEDWKLVAPSPAWVVLLIPSFLFCYLFPFINQYSPATHDTRERSGA
jgi:RmuC family